MPSTPVEPSVPAAGDAPTLTVDGPVATIRLCRPAHHNRIDPDDLPVLMAHLDRIEADPQVRVLLWRGSGERSFSSGYTVEAILSRLQERAFEAFLNRLETFPRTTIAVIHGGVYGGATDLALCCDLRIGVTTGRMFMPAARFGLHYTPDGLRRYLSRLGRTATGKLMLTAATIDAAEMLRIGFLTDCVEPARLEAAVAGAVAAALACEPGAVAAMKASLADLGAVDPAVLAAVEARFLASLRSPALQARLSPAPGRPKPGSR